MPYEIDYKVLGKCRKCGTLLIIVISFLSVLIPLVNHYNGTSWLVYIAYAADYLNLILIICYYVLSIITEVFLYPAAARKNRLGFIDNSLGSKYLEQPVVGYYSNEAITHGPYKMMVNCFENCFFTFSISKAMTPQVILKNALFVLILVTVSYFGIMNNLVILPILQILLSSLFISELVHHLNFVSKLGNLYDRFKSVFSDKVVNEQMLQNAILLLLEYETTKAYNKAPTSDRVFLKLDEKLSNEWEEIKERYEIK
jgi:hypothetical protein